MLKNQRQNLVMENEFHIKEERVKAQQSNAKTHDKDADSTKSSSTTASSSTTTTTSAKPKKDSSGDSKNSSGTAKESTKASTGATSSVKTKTSSHEAIVKKEVSSSDSTTTTTAKKSAEKTKEKEKSCGKDTARKPAVKEEQTSPCWDVAPHDPASASTPQSVSGNTTPCSSTSGEKIAAAKHLSPAVHNGPAASPKRRQVKADSPEQGSERGEDCVVGGW